MYGKGNTVHSSRLEAAKLLTLNKTYNEIEENWASTATISRINDH